jgi:hypothetical protein
MGLLPERTEELPTVATKLTFKSPAVCVTVCGPRAPPEEFAVKLSVEVSKFHGPCAKVKNGSKNKMEVKILFIIY